MLQRRTVKRMEGVDVRRLLLAAVAAVLTLAVPAAEGSLDTRRQCSQTNVVACIDQAAARYHQSAAEMELVAWRESRDEPWVHNGPCIGLFEINYPGTWDGFYRDGRFVRSPYADRSPWSARWSALNAAWLWMNGFASEWSTYP